MTNIVETLGWRTLRRELLIGSTMGVVFGIVSFLSGTGLDCILDRLL